MHLVRLLAVPVLQHVEHELGFLDRAMKQPRLRAERRESNVCVGRKRFGEASLALDCSARGGLALGGWNERVDALVEMFGERLRLLALNDAHHMTRAILDELGAQRHGAL